MKAIYLHPTTSISFALLLPYILGSTAGALHSNCTNVDNCTKAMNEEDFENSPCITLCRLNGHCCSDTDQTHADLFPVYDQVERSLQCITPHLNIKYVDEDWYEVPGVMMISSCMTELFDERCTKPNNTILLEALPHMSVQNGIYKNIYCGRCNNDTELIPWEPYITCSHINLVKGDSLLFPNSLKATYTSAISSAAPSCGIEFRPPNNVSIAHELCYNKASLWDTCEINETRPRDSCDRLTLPYLYSEDNITTFLCYFCQASANMSVNTSQESKTIKTADNTFIGRLNYEDIRIHDISDLFLEVDALIKQYARRPTNCDQDQLYDPYTEQCRRWYCQRDSAVIDGVCVPVFSQIEKATYQVRLNVVPENSSRDVFDSVDKYNITIDLLSAIFTNDRVKSNLLLLAEQHEGNFLYIIALLDVVEPISDTITGFIGIDSFEGSYTIPVESGELLQLNVSLATAVKVESAYYPGSHVVAIDLPAYSVMKNIYRRNEADIKTLYKYPMIDKLSFCIQIALDKNEFLDFNDIIQVLLSDVKLFMGEFERTLDGRTLRMCFNDYMRLAAEKLPYKDKPVYYSPQAILSITCNLLSITGLTATVLTYFIFGELRSIPGKNNMMLAIHLLIAQCLYQFGIEQTEFPTLCIILGALIHLFWLTSILWMNACTLHMFRTFVTGQSYRSYRAFDPQVCFYALYCYTVALTVIGINIGVSLYKSDGESTGYGGSICYISTPIMVGWTFALPVGIIIILNMGFFFAVVYQISASTMRRRGKSNDRGNTIIYMKLSSLTGVTWIFGYLYLWTDFVPLEYIFIVLNAGQGVLIFVSFICTSRIIHLYQDLFRKIGRAFRHGDCCGIEEKAPDRSIKTIEMNIAKHVDSKSHSTSRTQDTAVVINPTVNVVSTNTGGGSVLIKPSMSGVVIVGAIVPDGQSEQS